MKKIILILGFFLIMSTVFYSCTLAISGVLWYDDIFILSTESASRPVKWSSGNADQYKLEYSIKDAPTWLRVDKVTGKVSVSSEAVVQAETEYTITAKGTENTKGEETGTIKIAIQIAISDLVFDNYTDITIPTGAGSTVESGVAKGTIVSTANVTVSYSIAWKTEETAIPDVMVSVADDGKVTATKATGKEGTTDDVGVVYVVTATGTGKYTGTQTAEILIKTTK